MTRKIKLKRGLQKDLPTFDVAEPGFATDSERFYIGGLNGNVEIATQNALNQSAIESDLSIEEAQERITELEEELEIFASQTAKIYGVQWDKGSDPVMTRIDDSIGMIANVGVDDQLVRNDFDSAHIYREIGEVQDELGNVFIRIPKFYIRKTDGPGYKAIQISKAQHGGFYLPKCFWDFENNAELDFTYIGKYRASKNADGKLQSVPNVYPMRNNIIVETRNAARLNNDEITKGYQQYDIHIHDVLSTLFYVEFATLDSQAVMSGFTSGEYSSSHVAVLAETQTNRFVLAGSYADEYRVNQSIGIGTSRGGNQITDYRTITAIEEVDAENKAIVFDGDPLDIEAGYFIYNTGYKTGFSKDIAASSGSLVSNTDGKHACSYRGIESPWGDMWCFVDGVNINDHQAWVAEDADDYASNVFAHPYEQVGYLNSVDSGYPTLMGWDAERPYIELPVETGGNPATYYSDYYYQNSGQRVLVLGGWSSGSIAGLSCWYGNASSATSSVSFGGRLCLKNALEL